MDQTSAAVGPQLRRIISSTKVMGRPAEHFCPIMSRLIKMDRVLAIDGLEILPVGVVATPRKNLVAGQAWHKGPGYDLCAYLQNN